MELMRRVGACIWALLQWRLKPDTQTESTIKTDLKDFLARDCSDIPDFSNSEISPHDISKHVSGFFELLNTYTDSKLKRSWTRPLSPKIMKTMTSRLLIPCEENLFYGVLGYSKFKTRGKNTPCKKKQTSNRISHIPYRAMQLPL